MNRWSHQRKSQATPPPAQVGTSLPWLRRSERCRRKPSKLAGSRRGGTQVGRCDVLDRDSSSGCICIARQGSVAVKVSASGGRRRQRSRSWRSLDETGQTRPRCSCPQDRSHRSMSEAVMVAVTIGIQANGAVQIRCATWHRSRRILDRDRSGYCGTDVRTIRSAHIQRLVSSLGTVIRHRRRIRPAFSFRHFERAHGKTISRGGRRHRRGIHRHPTWRSAQLDRGIGCRSPSPRCSSPFRKS